jgi:hypothetical protein
VKVKSGQANSITSAFRPDVKKKKFWKIIIYKNDVNPRLQPRG